VAARTSRPGTLPWASPPAPGAGEWSAEAAELYRGVAGRHRTGLRRRG